jgi:hypothetical protein
MMDNYNLHKATIELLKEVGRCEDAACPINTAFGGTGSTASMIVHAQHALFASFTEDMKELNRALFMQGVAISNLNDRLQTIENALLIEQPITPEAN